MKLSPAFPASALVALLALASLSSCTSSLPRDQRPSGLAAADIRGVVGLMSITSEDEAPATGFVSYHKGSAVILDARRLITSHHIWIHGERLSASHDPDAPDTRAFYVYTGARFVDVPPEEEGTIRLAPDGKSIACSHLKRSVFRLVAGDSGRGDWALIETADPAWRASDAVRLHGPASASDWQPGPGEHSLVVGFASAAAESKSLLSSFVHGPMVFHGSSARKPEVMLTSYDPDWMPPLGASGGAVLRYLGPGRPVELVGVFHSSRHGGVRQGAWLQSTPISSFIGHL